MRNSLKQLFWMSSGTPASAFDDVWGWWRADTYTGSNPTITLTDLSGNGRNMLQVAGTLTPGTAANGQARIVGNATARLTNAATLKRWPVTIITVGRRTAGATCGFFGHQGATSFNSLWTGYESTNRHYIYNTNGTVNTTTDAGVDACWIARIGYFSRVPIVNGIIQTDMALSSMVRGSASAVSLGTEYRGLNFDFYETLVWDRTLSISELDEVHAYINERYSMSIPLWSSYSEAKVIRLRGQSNASGRGIRGASDANIPAEYDAAITGANVWNGTVTSLVGDAFGTLNVNSNNHMLGENNVALTAQTYFGPELTLCKEYLDSNGGEIYLQKFAIGGTPLNYAGASVASWDSINETLTQNNSNRILSTDMTNWWKALKVHQTNSRKPRIIGDIWYQGEQDSLTESYANAYATNLQSFFSRSDSDMGFTGKKLICRINQNAPEPYVSTVRTQQASAISLISNSTLVNTDDLTVTVGDEVHLNFTGQLDLGTRLAALL